MAMMPGAEYDREEFIAAWAAELGVEVAYDHRTTFEVTVRSRDRVPPTGWIVLDALKETLNRSGYPKSAARQLYPWHTTEHRDLNDVIDRSELGQYHALASKLFNAPGARRRYREQVIGRKVIASQMKRGEFDKVMEAMKADLAS